MLLSQGSLDKKYKIETISAQHEILRRLEALGMNEGTNISIMNKKRNGSLVIQVRGTKWALGKSIAETIVIREEVQKAEQK